MWNDIVGLRGSRVEDKRPKTLRGGTSAKMCVGCPKLGKRLRYEAGRGAGDT